MNMLSPITSIFIDNFNFLLLDKISYVCIFTEFNDDILYNNINNTFHCLYVKKIRILYYRKTNYNY